MFRMRWGVCFLFLFLLCPVGISAAETDPCMDLSALEDAVEQLDETLDGTISLSDLLTDMIHGDFSLDLSSLWDTFLSLVLRELRTFSALLSQLLLLGVVGAVFHVFAESFPQGSISKVGQWVLFLAFLLVAVKNFHLALELGTGTIERAADFLCAVLPVLLTSFALTGGAVAASVVQPSVLAVITLFLGLLERFFLPLLLVAAALVICSQLTSRYSFRKFYELIRSVILIALGFMMTVFTGLLSLESFAAGTVDGLTLKTAKMATGSFIPLVGGYIADAFDSILGAGLLLRSSIGIFGVIAVFAVMLVPALRILLMAFLFKLTAAVLQPFGDDAFVASLSDFSSVLMLLFALLVCAGLLFFFLIFCIVGVSNMTMMFR
ncbi:MAG: stage III sporulation protein AE [Clostridia bacterium]